MSRQSSQAGDSSYKRQGRWMAFVRACRQLPVRIALAGSAAWITLVVLASMAEAAQAQPQGQPQAQSIFSCRDANGRLLTSDRPIPECANRTLTEKSVNGTVKREFAPPLTPEQQRQKAIDDHQRAIAEAFQRQQVQRDRALLLAYSSIKALENARQRQLADIDQDVLRIQKKIVETHAELIAAQADAAPYKGKTLPYGIRTRIFDAANSILSDDAQIRSRREEQIRLNERFDEDSRRLRTLLREPESIAQGPAR